MKFERSCPTLVSGCRLVANQLNETERARALQQSVEAIRKLEVSDEHKVLFLTAKLIENFGEEVVQLVLKALPENYSNARGENSAQRESSANAAAAGPATPAAAEPSGEENVVTLHPEAATSQ